MNSPDRAPGHPALPWAVQAMRCVALACAVALTAPQLAQAQAQAPTKANQDAATEPSVKAAYLLKFGAYVEWPAKAFENATSPLVIGVLGSDAVADNLAQTASGRTVNGRTVEVRRLRHDDAPTGLHILFAARPERPRLVELLAQLKVQAVLIVVDDEDLNGSTINFVIVDNRVRFDVSLPPSNANGFKISSRLLGVARKVNNRPS